MRIAIVHSFYSEVVPSGENSAVRSQVAALESAGHDVHLIEARTDSLQSSRSYAARAALRVASGYGSSPIERLQNVNPEIVHVHNLFPNWGTRWLDRWTKSPVVATLHNFRFACAAGTFFRDQQECTLCPDVGAVHAIRHSCYRDSSLATIPLAIATRGRGQHDRVISRADILIALSNRAAKMSTDHGSINPAKVRIVPNFSPQSTDESMIATSDYWLFAGRLSPEKGIRELMSSWPEGHRLVIAGDGPMMPQITAHSREDFDLRGQVTHDELLELMRGAHALMFPSLWSEGAPMTYVEALSVGCPVVAFSANSVADDVLEQGTGMVFESFADIQNVLAILGQMPHLREKCRDVHAQLFTEASWVNSIQRVYEEAANI